MEFVRYTVAGGLATVTHYVVLLVLVEGLHAAAWLSAALGAACGAAAAYAANRRFAFRSRRRHASAIPRFLLVAAACAAFTGGLVWVATTAFGWHYVLAQLAATLLFLMFGYGVNRAWTFA